MYTLDIIKNKIKQLVAIVVLVGTPPPPLSTWTAMILAQTCRERAMQDRDYNSSWPKLHQTNKVGPQVL